MIKLFCRFYWSFQELTKNLTSVSVWRHYYLKLCNEVVLSGEWFVRKPSALIVKSGFFALTRHNAIKKIIQRSSGKQTDEKSLTPRALSTKNAIPFNKNVEKNRLFVFSVSKKNFKDKKLKKNRLWAVSWTVDFKWQNDFSELFRHHFKLLFFIPSSKKIQKKNQKSLNYAATHIASVKKRIFENDRMENDFTAL